MSLPEIDGAIEPIIYAGREGATGRSVPLADRVQLVADRALKVWFGEGGEGGKSITFVISIVILEAGQH